MLSGDNPPTEPRGDAMQRSNDEKADDDWQAFVSSETFRGSKERRFSAKDVLYREGDPVDRVFIIRSGMVKLLNYLPNGRARIVRLHSQLHWLGLEGLVDQAYEHTAVAVDDVDVVYVAIDRLHVLERDNPRQYCQLLKQGYRHLAQADRWLADFSTGGVRSRVARLVDFLAKLEYGELSDRVDLLTVHEMADMLGVSQESVSRILAEFKRNDTLHRLNSDLDEAYGIDALRLQDEAQQ